MDVKKWAHFARHDERQWVDHQARLALASMPPCLRHPVITSAMWELAIIRLDNALYGGPRDFSP